MNALSAAEFESIGTILKDKALSGPAVINRYSATGNYRSLLKPESTKIRTISREAREIRFHKPTYIERVDVLGPNAEKLLEHFSLVAITADGARVAMKPRLATFSESGGAQKGVLFDGGHIVVAIEAKSTRAYLNLSASKIRVVGYSVEQLGEVARSVCELRDIHARIDSYIASKANDVSASEAQKQALESEIEEREEQISQLTTSRDSLAEAVQALDAKNDTERTRQRKLEQQATELRATLEALQNNESQLRVSVEGLNKEISSKQKALEELENDRNLISDEYRDYVAEGKQQSRTYEWFLYLSITIIGACSWQLYSGAARILEADATSLQEVLALALQRLPFAAALAIIVGLSWKLAELFVSRIMTIHSQRLALARLLVIAKDTVYAASSGLAVSNEQKFRERIQLKLAMLRSHLTSELGRDFEYVSPTTEEIPSDVKAKVDEELQTASAKE